MGMSTYVIGFKPPDEKWKQMKAVWDACEKAKVEIPDEVLKYFEYVEPDSAGVEIELETEEWDNAAGCAGYQLHVDKIPRDVKIIRFYNSW